MRKVLVCALLCIALLFALSVFDPFEALSKKLLQREEPAVVPIVRSTIVPLTPRAGEGQVSGVEVTLYHRYLDTAYLGQEEYLLSVPMDSTVEKAIVSALLDGPDGRHTSLSSVFPEGTRVIAATKNGDTVTVTLNRAFLTVPEEATAVWQQDEYWAREVPLRRRMALEALVLSLTEDARCQQVQLLVEAQEEGAAPERLARAFFYPEEGNAGIALEAIARDVEALLTPRVTVQLALEAWLQKDFERLYNFLNATIGDGKEPMPSVAEFAETLSLEGYTLLDFQAQEGSISPDNARATVTADITYAGANGAPTKREGVSFALRRIGGDWKISYTGMWAIVQGK